MLSVIASLASSKAGSVTTFSQGKEECYNPHSRCVHNGTQESRARIGNSRVALLLDFIRVGNIGLQRLVTNWFNFEELEAFELVKAGHQDVL
jgi:Zn-dependent alcohol dehydrogenase